MDIRGCGLDVHKKTIAACIMGIGLKKEIRTYNTMTNDLLRLKMWLKENFITQVAMRAQGYTGNRYSTYWKTALT